MNKLLITTLSLILLPVLAFAEVTFNDVTDKMKTGDVRTADMLTKQMLKDHPDSAKAHYYMGQILSNEGEFRAARSELKKAAELDKSLSFAASPDKFRQAMDKVEMNLGRAETPKISSHDEGASGWWIFLCMLGVGGLLYWLFRSDSGTVTSSSSGPIPRPSSPSSLRPGHVNYAASRPVSRPVQSSYAPPSPQVVNNNNSSNNGLMEGIILGSMMSDRGGERTIVERERIVERDEPASRSFDSGRSDSGSSFDSGSSSGFDSGSSSFDSGSSSFDSGGSSFDSGGSGD